MKNGHLIVLTCISFFNELPLVFMNVAMSKTYNYLLQTISHNLSADSQIMSSWFCPRCHRMKSIAQMRHQDVLIDLDVTSQHRDFLDMDGLTLFQFYRNLAQDIQSSKHGIEIVGLLPMASH